MKCSHGSTSGAIDETALFYLRSRGVPMRQAQALLVLAFLAEAIAEIEDEAIAEDIRSPAGGLAGKARPLMSVTHDIVASWRHPRAVVRRHCGAGRRRPLPCRCC